MLLSKLQNIAFLLIKRGFYEMSYENWSERAANCLYFANELSTFCAFNCKVWEFLALTLIEFHA